MEKQFTFKVGLIGDPAVGKTSLINRYVMNEFKENYQSTLGTNILLKDVEVPDFSGSVKLTIWDIAGQDKYELSRKMFFQGCVGSFLVYDVTRSSTFEKVKNKWIKDLQTFGAKGAIHILIGNKCDLPNERKISSEDGQKLANEINSTDFIETSAKTGDRVEEAFMNLVLQILKSKGEL